jgi:uncharacterized protein YbjT (DUF2867 family)
MYTIMGATGNIGSKIVNIMLEKGEKIRAVGRSAQRLQTTVNMGAEPAVGDVADVSFLARAFEGAAAVFAMIPPAYGTADFRRYYNEIGDNIATAIQDTGVRYLVFLSSHGAHLAEKTGPIKGLYDAEQRFNTLDEVHKLYLRPTYFMENLLAGIGLIKNMGINGSGIRADTRFAMIATQDIASVAAEHLIKKDFSGTLIRELFGQRDLSMNEVTGILGEKIGKPDLTYVHFSTEEEKKGLMDFGMSDDASDQMVELNQAISNGLVAVNQPRTPENTTQTTIEEFAEVFARIYEIS